jgi:hypothetical protein
MVVVVFATVLAISLTQSAHSLALTLSLFGAGVAVLIVVGIVQSTLSQIFLAGLYRYATTGSVPAGFSHDLVQQAFKPKPKP